MPWSAADYPASMRNLTPEARRAAISVANAILKDGGDEGKAITAGIAKAEEQFGKGKKKSGFSSDRAQFLAQIPE